MSILKKIFGGPADEQSAIVQPWDDPTAQKLRRQQQQGKWKPVREFLAKLSSPHDREFYFWALSEWEGRPEFFDAWINADPDNSDAHLLRGAHLLNWAWEARTGAKAEDVADDAWPVFRERLSLAWDDLEKALIINPRDPLIHAYRVSAITGMNGSKKAALNELKAARLHDKEHRFVHQRTLWCLSEKWLGSHDEMFGVARSSCNGLPEGSHLHVLIANAHVERWLYLDAFEGDAEAAESYWQDAAVKAEIKDAYLRSLGSPKHQDSKMTLYDANFFAFCLALTGEGEYAQNEFQRIGKRPTEFPWVFYGEPAAAYRSFREWVGVPEE